MRRSPVRATARLAAMGLVGAAGCSTASTGISTVTGAAADSGSGGANADSSGTAVCPRSGVILADVRDVERAGEGLVATTFGDTSTGHQADWKYAGQVLAILKQVWRRSTMACTDLPGDNVRRIDEAVAELDVAIVAMNQQSAVFAANAVGLAVVELFDYFHPDAPKEVVRMDAVFRQVGIDAHFGKSSDARRDIDSLKTDWAAAKAAVSVKVPTCHRVGGTATVVGDVEQSLANLDAAFAASATLTMEQESDNGAIEVDTLELLFDCPADSLKPDTGLGSACTANMKCDTGQVCDAAFGKCAPDPSTAKIGVGCTTTVDCGTNPRSACLTEAGDLYPGGYCGMEPCNDLDVCPPGATCVAIGGEAPGCYKTCTSDSDCRTADGYVCQTFSTAPPAGFGPSSRACAFRCTEDAQCQPCKGAGSDQCQKLTCDVATGQCKP